jgi:comEA protein
MNVFRTVRDFFVFTRNEQKILFVLSVVFLAGAGIKAYRAATGPPPDRSFEYAQTDSVFAARTRAPMTAGADTAHGAVDLNKAGRMQFIALPGIGPKLADRILAYRAAHGRFRTVHDVTKVAGIGPKKFERLREKITVTSETGH